MGASVAFASASPLLETFKLSSGAAAKYFAVLQSEPKINVNKGIGIQIKNFKGRITFKNVSFRYPSRPEIKVTTN